MLLNTTDAELQALINEEPRPILIDFWAPWCGPCKAVAPLLDELNEKVGDKLVIAKVNTDENRQLAAKFQLRSIPTMILIQNGQVLRANVGAMTGAALSKFVSDVAT